MLHKMLELPRPTIIRLEYNDSLVCDGDLERDSCYQSSVQVTQLAT